MPVPPLMAAALLPVLRMLPTESVAVGASVKLVALLMFSVVRLFVASAVIGPFADDWRTTLGPWVFAHDHEATVTVLEGMRRWMPVVTICDGAVYLMMYAYAIWSALIWLEIMQR